MNQATYEIVLRLKKGGDLAYQSVMLHSYRRLLNQDVEEYLIEEVEKSPRNSELVISLRISDPAFKADELRSMIVKHFEYTAGKSWNEVRKLLDLGWRSLIVAFIFLIILYLTVTALANRFPGNTVVVTLKEAFLVIGWVGLWRPAEFLLYDWRPHTKRAKICERIARSKIEVVNETVPVNEASGVASILK